MRYDGKQTDRLYTSAAWRRVRSAVLMRDHYMCVRCVQAYREGHGGRPRKATLVHHIEPYRDAPELALNMDNLQSLCEVCHNQLHTEKGARHYPADAPPFTTKARVIKI